MAEDPIAVLLQEDVWEKDRTPRWLIAAGSVVAAAFAVVALWWVFRPAADETEPTTTVADAAATTTEAPSYDLVALPTDPLVLNLPTVAPLGWERCSGARLCDPGDPSRGVSRRTLQTRLVGTAPTGVPGLVYSDGDALDIALVFPTTAGIAFRGSGIGRQDLLRMVSSVPIAGDWAPTVPTEPPLTDDPPVEVVAGVAGVDADQVEASFGSFRVDVLALEVIAEPVDDVTPELTLEIRADVATWSEPVSVSDERSLIVGMRGSFGRAVWLQRGYAWSIFADMDVRSITDLALRLEDAIAELP